MKPLPKVMTYEDWTKQTSSLLHKRSRELKQVDTALQKYQRSPSHATLLELTRSFDAWKLAHGTGTEWKDSTRNTKSYATLLDNQLQGIGDTDVALGAQAFMEPALINSRLGVLYLYSTLECDNVFKVILDGALDLTSASLDFAEGPELIGTGIEKGKDVAGKGANLLETKIRERLRKEGQPKPVSSSQLLDANAPPPPGKLRELWNKIRDKLYELATKLIALAKEQWQKAKSKLQWAKADPGGTALEIGPTALRKLCDFLASHVLTGAAPFISAGLDIAKGVLNTIDAGITKYKEWAASKQVTLMTGHPATIAESIRRAMWFDVGQGLYDTLKSGVDLGIQIASSGASAIISFVMSAVEALAKTIWKLVEVVKIRGVFSDARELWKARNSPDSLHLRPIAFNAWFKSHAMMLPALPVMVLNSGICGDKMHFMKMFKDDDTVITQASFDAGCSYIDSLKSWGSDYLRDCGFTFTSKDKVVQGLIRLAGKHEDESSSLENVWKATLGFVNA